MSKSRSNATWPLVGYFLLALICTFPLALQLGSAVKDHGDPLLNSWILAWETHNLFDEGARGFFNTNIFYLHHNTLAYSEFLIPQLVLAAPVILATGNPILAHNLVLLLSLVATAMATYLLALKITGNRIAAFAAGLILAFCPFMFGHLSQVQIFFAAGIPLTFLMMLRWLESHRTRDAVILALVYSIQVLGNTYYAVYLTFFAGIVFAFQLLRRRLWSNKRFWLQALLIGTVAFAITAPFYIHYLQLKQEMGFERVLPPSTPLSAYLAAPSTNLLYGKLTEQLGQPEGHLFPGFVALGLALLGLLRWWTTPGQARFLGLPRSGWTFPLILLSAFVLSLGTGPYQILYRWIPGFSSLRAVSRIHVMFMFALAVLAAQGLAYLLDRASGPRRRRLAIILPALIALEYFSAPLALKAAPDQSEFPAVLDWAAERGEDLVLITYPLKRVLPSILEVYQSTEHWQRMVNGYSGFIPPLYLELTSKGSIVPSQEAVADLQELGVDLLLFETHRFKENRQARLVAKLRELEGLEEVHEVDGTVVFQIQPLSPDSDRSSPAKSPSATPDRLDITLETNTNQESLHWAIDGDRSTKWQAPMEPGPWIEIQLKEPARAQGLEFDISGFPRDYPRGYRLETSLDGRTWQMIETVERYYPPIRDFLVPTNFQLRFEFPPLEARALRFVQTGTSPDHSWTIVEVTALVAE